MRIMDVARRAASRGSHDEKRPSRSKLTRVLFLLTKLNETERGSMKRHGRSHVVYSNEGLKKSRAPALAWRGLCRCGCSRVVGQCRCGRRPRRTCRTVAVVPATRLERSKRRPLLCSCGPLWAFRRRSTDLLLRRRFSTVRRHHRWVPFWFSLQVKVEQVPVADSQRVAPRAEFHCGGFRATCCGRCGRPDSFYRVFTEFRRHPLSSASFVFTEFYRRPRVDRRPSTASRASAELYRVFYRVIFEPIFFCPARLFRRRASFG